MRPQDDAFQFLGLDTRAARELEDAGDMTPRQRRQMGAFVRRRNDYFSRHLNEQVTASSELLLQVSDQLEDGLIDLAQQTRRVKVDLAKGRMTAAEGRKRLADIGHESRVIRERADQLKSDDEALAALAAMTPEEYESYLVGTYPALRGCGPTLTVADLNQP